MDAVQTVAAPFLDTAYPALAPVEALEREFVLAPGETGVTALRVDRRETGEYEGEQNRQGVRIGELGLMIHFDDSSELTDIPRMYHLPNAPHWVLGVVNLHGRLIPVFDLLRFLHVDRSPDSGKKTLRLLILGHDANAAAVVIDGLPYRLRWRAEQRVEADLAPKMLEPHVRASCMIDGQIWFDLDCKSMLDALEADLAR